MSEYLSSEKSVLRKGFGLTHLVMQITDPTLQYASRKQIETVFSSYDYEKRKYIKDSAEWIRTFFQNTSFWILRSWITLSDLKGEIDKIHTSSKNGSPTISEAPLQSENMHTSVENTFTNVNAPILPSVEIKVPIPLSWNEKFPRVNSIDELPNSVGIFGDSLTVGMRWKWGSEIHDWLWYAKVGISSSQVLANLGIYIQKNPNTKMVFILAGTNDMMSGSSIQTIKNLQEIQSLCQSKWIHVVLGTLPPMWKHLEKNPQKSNINQAIEEVNAFIKSTSHFIDYHKATQVHNNPTYLERSRDGLHPSDYSQMRKALLEKYNSFLI